VLRADLDQHRPAGRSILLGRAIRALAPAARAGIPVAGVEPSSTAVLHADAVELLGDDLMSMVELKKRSLTDRDGAMWRPAPDTRRDA
jgi:hypothetical protein